MNRILVGIIVLTSIFSYGNTGQTSNEALSILNKKLENSKNKSQDIFDFIDKELKLGPFQSQNELVESFRKVEKIHSTYDDINYVHGLCLITFRLHLISRYNDAYYYLYKARKLHNQIEIKDEKFIKLFYNINSSSAFYFMQFDKSNDFALNELKCKVNTAEDSISILNMLGLIKYKSRDLDKSLYYYSKAIEIAKRINAEFWIGLISGNMGNIYFEKKEFVQARKLCQFDVKYSLKSGEKESATAALALIILIDLSENKIPQAQKHINDLLLIKIDNPSFALKRLIEKTKYQLLEKQGNYKNALESYKIYNLLSDTIEKDKDFENLKRTEFQIDFEQENAKFTILEERKKRDEIIYYGIITFASLGILALIIILYQVIKRRNRERYIALLQKRRLDEELKQTEKEMRSILVNLMEKNELIELLNGELELIQENSTLVSEEKQKIKDKLTTFKLLTEDDWIEFKRLFETLNPNFFEKVHLHFSDVTNAEIRLITLSKLNLQTVEISRALGISPDSVRKTNLRLRKKVGIEDQDELIRLILSI